MGITATRSLIPDFRDELSPTNPGALCFISIYAAQTAVKTTQLNCHRHRSNEVRLWLSVIAYNLGNLWRRLVPSRRINNRSITRLQQRLLKPEQISE